MAFSRIVSSVISKHLHNYIEDFKEDEFQINFLKGQTTVKNLKLKPNVLNDLHLPVSIREGFIGELVLTLPWTHLASQCTTVKISDLFLVVKAKEELISANEAPEEVLEKLFRAKMARLNLARLLGSDTPKKENDKKSFISRIEEEIVGGIVLKILDSIQIYIENIHIRYEDEVSNKKHPFAIGLFVGGIQIESTDHSWNPLISGFKRDIMKKRLQLQHLGIYFDTNNPDIRNYTTTEEFAKHMRDIIEEKKGVSVSAVLKSTVNFASPTSSPRVVLQLEIDSLNASLNQKQLRRAADAWRMITKWKKAVKYPLTVSKRPREIVPVSPQSWWLYAFSMTQDDVRNRQNHWNWDWMRIRLQARRTYLELYKKVVKQEELSVLEESQLESIHREYSYDDLLSWRKLVNASIEVEEIPLGKKIVNFFRSLSTSKEHEHEDTEAALKELWKMIGYKEEGVLAEKKDQNPKAQIAQAYMHTMISVQLNSFTFQINAKPDETLLDLQLSILTTGVKFYPEATSLVMRLGSFQLLQHITKPRVPSKLLSPITTLDSSPDEGLSSVLELDVDVKPFNIDAGLAVKVSTQPVLLSVSESVALRMLDYFDTIARDNELIIAQFTEKTTKNFDDFYKAVEAEIRYAIQDNTQLYLDLNLSSITVLLPAQERISDVPEESPAIVLSTGFVSITNKTIATDQYDDVLQHMFDTYNVHVSRLTVYSVKDVRFWNTVQLHHLLAPFDMDLVISQKSVQVPDDLPNTKISACSPELTINISTQELADVLTVVKCGTDFVQKLEARTASMQAKKSPIPVPLRMGGMSKYVVEEAKAPSDVTQIFFQMEKVKIILRNLDSEILNVGFNHFRGSIEQNSSNMVINGTLKAIFIDKLLDTEPNSILEKDVDFMTFNFTSVNPNEKLDVKADNRLAISCGVLHFLVDRVRLERLLNEVLMTMRRIAADITHIFNLTSTSIALLPASEDTPTTSTSVSITTTTSTYTTTTTTIPSKQSQASNYRERYYKGSVVQINESAPDMVYIVSVSSLISLDFLMSVS